MAGHTSTGSSLAFYASIALFFYLIRGANAFGAGNIAGTSRIEGTNWRHGDIEDTLLTLLISRASGRKFSKLDVKRVYFGNWLRDYSQAVDVGSVKYVSAEAVRLILWVLGFMSFGFATREFEVTRDRLGCYRPEEHIDNPKDYADNEDARNYDRRLRAPVNERIELAVDERTGLKAYIASEDRGITTSAGMVRDLLRRCIHLARQSKRNRNDEDFYEALRLLGTANHCMEDYSAHSNYTELALIEMGERDVFPHVGRRTQINLRGARSAVYPIVTGTFGGVDFIHSLCGEVTDKVTQSEITELEGVVNESQRNQNVSKIKELLDQLPDGLIGGGDNKSKVDELQANAAAGQMQNMNISPKEPEAFTRQAGEITRQIYPVLEFHDQIMRSITEAIENIPMLPDLIEELQNQISMFCFSLIAPFVLPIIGQVKAEMATGSSEVIQSSKDKQHIVFEDDNSSDPTHSMLSKDHFSNLLNEPAGKIASQVLKWAVPQIVDCWDDERADAERVINRIINGVFHHPALRDAGDDGAQDGRRLMFGVVEKWWGEKSDREKAGLRDQLSRRGVEEGRNHKEGVHDTGHGCGKPLAFANMAGGNAANPLTSAAFGAVTQGINQALSGDPNSGIYNARPGAPQNDFGKMAGEAAGGGILGSMVGGLVGGVGASLLGGAFGGSDDQHETYQQQGYTQDGGYQTSTIETAHRPGGQGRQDKYGQAEYKRTDYPSGERREAYTRVEQDGRSGQTGYGFEHTVESRRTEGGGYQRTGEETHYGSGGQHQSSSYGDRRSDNDDDEDEEKKERKRREKAEKERKKREKKYGGGRDEESEDSDDNKYKRRSGEHSRREESGYGGGESRHHGGGGGGGYGGQQQSYGGGEERSGYGRETESYGRQDQSGYGAESRSSGYGQQDEYGRRDEEGYGGDDDNEYGGRRRRDEGRSGYGGGYGDSGYGNNY